MKKLCENWDLKKHAKIVWGIYGVCCAIDLVLGFFIVRKLMERQEKTE